LGVIQNEPVHPKLESQPSPDENPESQQALERDSSKWNRHRALDLWWSMIFSENRYPLFRIMP
jgi:hypothetical protein